LAACCVEEKKLLRNGADGRNTELLVAWELPDRNCSVQMRATRIFIESGSRDGSGVKRCSRAKFLYQVVVAVCSQTGCFVAVTTKLPGSIAAAIGEKKLRLCTCLPPF
jgi:hypothetical protein